MCTIHIMVHEGFFAFVYVSCHYNLPEVHTVNTRSNQLLMQDWSQDGNRC